MFKDIYNNMNKQIKPDENLKKITQQNINEKLNKNYIKKHRRFYNRLIIAILLCIIISIPVVGEMISYFDILQNSNFISNEEKNLLEPIEMYCEDNGIKMNVIGAVNDKDTTIVYISLQDITKNRIDKYTNLDKFSVNNHSILNNQLVDYDENTKTAIIRIFANGGKDKLNQQNILTVNSFYSNKVKYEDVLLNLNISNIDKANFIDFDLDNFSGGGGTYIDELLKEKSIKVIKPNEEKQIINNDIDFVYITGIGYKDKMLHIQTYWEKGIDNHGFIFLKDNYGNEIKPTNLSFDIDKNNNVIFGQNYQEYLFKIDKSKLEEYEIYGTFIKVDGYTEVNLQTNFNINSVDNDYLVLNNLNIDNVKIEKLTLSSLGMQIKGKQHDISTLNIEAVTNDNKIINYDSVFTDKSNDIFNSKYMPHFPIEIKSIKEIKINETIIPLNSK